MYAARSGRYKAHFATQGSLQCGPNNTDSVCRPDQPYTVQTPPLVFDLMLDPSEQYPLEPHSPEYEQGLGAAQAVAEQHKRSLVWYGIFCTCDCPSGCPIPKLVCTGIRSQCSITELKIRACSLVVSRGARRGLHVASVTAPLTSEHSSCGRRGSQHASQGGLR